MGNTILCIEDNPHNMLLLKRVLQAYGYNMLEAETGLDGLRLAEENEVDLILLDINLPDIDGYEVLRRLHTHPKTSLNTLPTVVLSANALRGDDQKALDAGCNVYLTKPIDLQELKETLARFVPVPDTDDIF